MLPALLPSVAFSFHTNLDIFHPLHWKQEDFSLPTMRRALAMIPDDAPVSATNTVLPHLSMRDKAYMFPRRDDAEYALVLREVWVYPSNPEGLEEEIQKMKDSGEWEVLLEEGRIILMHRTVPAAP